MAKSDERNKAIELRQKGESIKEIANKIGVSKSTASIWCRDIVLTAKQIKVLQKRVVRGSYRGRLLGSRMQHERRIKRALDAEIEALKEIGTLSKRDLLIAFTALYWGEGSKKNRKLFINNSDPEMVKFLMEVFRKLFSIEDKRFILAVGINEIHKDRDDEVVSYWSKITGIPKEQFRKTIFIKAKNKKNYSNFTIHYGTLRINVEKSIDIYYRAMGLIKGLSRAL